MIAVLTVVMVAEVADEEEAGALAANAEQAARLSLAAQAEREDWRQADLDRMFRLVGTQVSVIRASLDNVEG